MGVQKEGRGSACAPGVWLCPGDPLGCAKSGRRNPAELGRSPARVNSGDLG